MSNERLLNASKALAEKLDQVTKDLSPMFAEMQIARGRGPYQGATYGEELDELNEAIKELEA
jgi:hypothetical protein